MLIALLAESAAHVSEHLPDDAPPPFPPFETWHMPSQLFWLAILFSILYLTLSRVILPKLSDTLEKRSDRIASDIDQAARLNDQALEAQQALELRLAQARNKARETSEKARQKMDVEMAAETARVDAEIEKKLDTADARIAGLRADAMKNVEQIAVDTADVILGRFGVSASKSELKKAVSAALE
ncbi:ATP synthase F0 subunit B [Hyphomonas johnsonii]|jgi:F-type H+-transporting ATPase subunit b|uniref:ATP synthase subunit b n=1 Tax=Hyphomonas johnsonii MHS-2 TaxID=1280950 RepID=A0A059FS29_9PROT|nr:ATP synthase F0 subunit B [Hyphomonas johnsonii]KCZ93326.1 ATP synthase F0 subunit B family protein [Hyphomonas johnsonii MHS-2]